MRWLQKFLRIAEMVILQETLQNSSNRVCCKLARSRDVVYGRRVKREATLFMQAAYKLFYRTFDHFSYLKIPHDAVTAPLLDRRVVVDRRFPNEICFCGEYAPMLVFAR